MSARQIRAAALLAVLGAAPPGFGGGSSARGYRMSEEARAKRDAERAARAPKMLERAAAKRERRKARNLQRSEA